MRARRVIGAIGRALVGVGVLMLLFVAYQLWGTGLAESSDQNALKNQFHHELSKNGVAAPGASAGCPPAMRTSTAAFTAPAPGQPDGELKIPKMGLDKIVVEGTGTDELRLGPGHYAGTALPGQPGNAAIAGHRTTYGAPFYNLDQLGTGDQICVSTIQGQFTYIVARSTVVDPTDTKVLASSTTPELTLTTCNPRFSDAQRLVVQAVLAPFSPPAPATSTPSGAGNGGGPSDAVISADLAGAAGSGLNAVWWGLACATVGFVLWQLAQHRRRRWLIYAAGAAPFAVALFFFYASLSPLLPASF